VPEEIISKDLFDAIQIYIITKPELKTRLITVNTLGHKIVGCPVYIDNKKYDRNALIFNCCFLFDCDTRTARYEPVVKKLAAYFTQLELESSFLSDEEKKSNIPSLLSQILQNLNKSGSCSMDVNDSCTISLKLSPLIEDPKPVQDHDVPVFLSDRPRVNPARWDLTTQQILQFIDGYNHAAKIAAEADIEINLVKACLQNLLHIDVITVISVFQYSNMFTTTSNLQQLIENPCLQAECLQAVATNSHVKPLFRDVFMLYCSLTQGLTVRDLCLRFSPHAMKIDEKKFIQFGLKRQLIRRVHGYPVRLPSEGRSGPKVTAVSKWLNGMHSMDEICCKEVGARGIQFNAIEDGRPGYYKCTWFLEAQSNENHSLRQEVLTTQTSQQCTSSDVDRMASFINHCSGKNYGQLMTCTARGEWDCKSLATICKSLQLNEGTGHVTKETGTRKSRGQGLRRAKAEFTAKTQSSADVNVPRFDPDEGYFTMKQMALAVLVSFIAGATMLALVVLVVWRCRHFYLNSRKSMEMAHQDARRTAALHAITQIAAGTNLSASNPNYEQVISPTEILDSVLQEHDRIYEEILARRKSSTKPNDNAYVNIEKLNKKGVLTKIPSDLNVILELSEHLDMPSSPARQQKKMNNELDQSLTNPDTSAALEFKRNDVVYSVPQKAYAPVAAEVVQPAVKDHNRNVSSDVAGYGQSNVACPPRKLTDIAADSTESKVGGQEETGQESEDSEEEDVGLEMHAIEPTEEDLWQGSMKL
ncbi:hypothetical protein DPMN_120770, partial [Dreissena polymorpha]